MRIFAILLATLHSAMAVTKYATALIRNSDGVTQGIEGVIKFEQVCSLAPVLNNTARESL
jgi:hypothetical protein